MEAVEICAKKKRFTSQIYEAISVNPVGRDLLSKLRIYFRIRCTNHKKSAYTSQ